MNVHDSDRMGETLARAGHTRADSIEEAKLVVFNTCSVREKAEQKLRSELGRFKHRKASEADFILAVSGCVAQQEGQALLKSVPHVDLVIGPDNIGELPSLLESIAHGSPPIARTVFDNEAPSFLTATGAGETPVSAFVTTMKGCDERCSFCIVPYTRGSERYRSAADILAEIELLCRAGAREITLLGQTVDSFRDPALPPPLSDDPDESQFPHLLEAIARRIPQLARLRYTSPHPRHLTPSLITAHATLPLLASHVHMPVQSGSDRILRRMIRRYTRAEYIARTQALKAAKPGLTLSTDIIVGFPGETREDFEATLSLVREVGFVSLFGFAYSQRPNTPALKLADDVPDEEKRSRLGELFAVADELTQAHLQTLLGTQQTILVEGPSKANANTLQGRTERNEIIHIAQDKELDLTGEIVEVRVDEVFRHSLSGSLVTRPKAKLRKAARTTEPTPERRGLPVLAS
jgi:tRNA-2-methylthio-N6-dimethylallyladenosine synthase